jgi:hypothetical protein
MEIMGLQIHKKDNFKALYEGVDLVLKKSDTVSGGVGKGFVQQSVAHALQSMFKNSSSFNICAVREASEASNIPISSQRMNLYRLAHCMKWGDMTADYKETLIAMIMDDFRELFINKKPKESNA